MVRFGLRKPVADEPLERGLRPGLLRWICLAIIVFIMASLAVLTSNVYCIVPPLIVACVEFANSKAGFRRRPVLTVALLFAGSLIGTLFQLFLHHTLGMPETIVAIVSVSLLFLIFERIGKCFAPAGALTLVPMLLPREALPLFPFQVLLGSIIFFTVANIFFCGIDSLCMR